MELVCPNCETHFFVADNAIGPNGRKVRCSVCKHEWKANPAGTPAASNTPTPAPTAQPAAPAGPVKLPADDEFHWPAETAAESGATAAAGAAKPPKNMEAKETPATPAPPPAASSAVRPAAPSQAAESPATAPSGSGAGAEAGASAEPATQKPAATVYTSPLQTSLAETDEPSSGGKRIAAGVILLLFVAASYLFRDQIVDIFPNAARLYELAGISVAGPDQAPPPSNTSQ